MIFGYNTKAIRASISYCVSVIKYSIITYDDDITLPKANDYKEVWLINK